MTMTVTLPEPLTTELKQRAKQLHIPANDLVVKIVRDALHDHTLGRVGKLINEDFASLEQVVAQIKAQPKDFQSFHPATKTIDEVLAWLAQLPTEEPEYSPKEWDQMWSQLEEEQKHIDQANDIAEGRF